MADLTVEKKLDIIISKLAKIESKVNRLDSLLSFPEEVVEEELAEEEIIDIDKWPGEAVERLLADIIKLQPATKPKGNIINVDFGKDTDV